MGHGYEFAVVAAHELRAVELGEPVGHAHAVEQEGVVRGSASPHATATSSISRQRRCSPVVIAYWATSHAASSPS